jgi:hypothetical protein
MKVYDRLLRFFPYFVWNTTIYMYIFFLDTRWRPGLLPSHRQASEILIYTIYKKYIIHLKVVGNENLGGSRGWLLVEGDTGLWRSMSVYFLM